MFEGRERQHRTESDERSIRTPASVAGNSLRSVCIMIAASIVFGALSALTLRWSAPAWWTSQILGIVGAVAAGCEYGRGRPAAIRGSVTGLFAAVAVICVHAFTSGTDVVNFNPITFLVTAVVASAGLHLGGAALRRRAPALARWKRRRF